MPLRSLDAAMDRAVKDNLQCATHVLRRNRDVSPGVVLKIGA